MMKDVPLDGKRKYWPGKNWPKKKGPRKNGPRKKGQGKTSQAKNGLMAGVHRSPVTSSSVNVFVCIIVVFWDFSCLLFYLFILSLGFWDFNFRFLGFWDFRILGFGIIGF